MPRTWLKREVQHSFATVTLWVSFSFLLGVESFIPMEEFKTGKVAEGTKPCLLFAGETFADTTNQGENF
jgi:hypothetical protein